MGNETHLAQALISKHLCGAVDPLSAKNSVDADRGPKDKRAAGVAEGPTTH